MVWSVIEWEGSKEGGDDSRYGGHWAVVAAAAASRVPVKSKGVGSRLINRYDKDATGCGNCRDNVQAG